MKLFRPLAGFCVFALAALPAVAQRGGGSSGHGGGYGGGAHASSGGGRSYGESSGHVSGGSYGSSSRAGGSGVVHGSGGSYSYSHAESGTREEGVVHGAGGAGGFTNSGGIRFSDFGFVESPRFTASMLPSNRGAAESHPGSNYIASTQRPDRGRRNWNDRVDYYRGYGYRRFYHSGIWFFGLLGPSYCNPLGPAAISQPYLYDDDNDAYQCFGAEDYAPDNGFASDDDASADDAYPADDDDDARAPDDPAVEPANETTEAPEATLLELKDGSMYGLTAYWVDGGELHYVTTYGGANAIALERIDLEKTVELNASHGHAFVLEERSAEPKAASKSAR